MRERDRLRLDMPATYVIRVQGWVSEQWRDWINGMTLDTEEDDEGSESTRLTGVVRDQAALLGLLQSLYTLGFALLEVRLIGPGAHVNAVGKTDRIE